MTGCCADGGTKCHHSLTNFGEAIRRRLISMTSQPPQDNHFRANQRAGRKLVCELTLVQDRTAVILHSSAPSYRLHKFLQSNIKCLCLVLQHNFNVLLHQKTKTSYILSLFVCLFCSEKQKRNLHKTN